uniref:Uncharacterized protein n=1 Tax=Anguilla anguilla TaxID=7936 RepID=A0A0E9PZX8_ANGAN
MLLKIPWKITLDSLLRNFQQCCFMNIVHSKKQMKCVIVDNKYVLLFTN